MASLVATILAVAGCDLETPTATRATDGCVLVNPFEIRAAEFCVAVLASCTRAVLDCNLLTDVSTRPMDGCSFVAVTCMRATEGCAAVRSDLADMLEAAMGWLGGHLHAFEAHGVLYETPDGESFGFRRPLDERKVRLGEVLPEVKSKMRWDYDFGDGWEHDVIVEAIEQARTDVTYPICLTGKRACPPEDCGGPWGYGNLLAALSDPTHEEHEELTEWVGEDFDPADFDADEATEDMRSARPLKGW